MTLNSERKSGRSGSLLLAVLAMLLLSFGVSSVWMTVWPVVVNSMTDPVVYYPSLPVSEDRDESFIEIKEIPPRQIYPSLSNVDGVEDGSWIRIPSIGVRVPLVPSLTMGDAQVLAVLDQGAALYPNGVLPGRKGNLFISAHSTGEPWKGAYRFAFLKINELTNNNLIHIDFDNTRYTYRIVSKDVIEPSKDLRIQSEGEVPTVTLMACWPLWSTKQRMLVRGELTNITKLSPSPI